MNVEQSFPVKASRLDRRSNLVVWAKKRQWFFLFVVLPTILAAVYYGLIASDVYVSESRFVIKSPEEKRAQLSTIANLIQTTGLSTGQEEANEVLEFIRSRDALEDLERNKEIKRAFSSKNADIFSRFPAPFEDDSFENLYQYYGKMIGAQLDSQTGTAVLTVKAFTPREARTINEKLLELSEGMVNRLNARAQTKGITEAQRQVDLASQRVASARVALAQFRNSQELIDPSKQAAGVIEIANTMIAQRAALQAQLDTMLRITPRNPSIPALRKRIDAITAQIASQDNRVVGTGGAIASKLGGYEKLLVEQEFATQNLNVASAGLVQARNDAQRQQFYLERIVDPNQPDAPLLPRRFLGVLVVAAASAFLYFVGWMFIVGILEHAPED